MSSRTVSIALGVSLTANLFLAGAIAGALYMQSQAPKPATRTPILLGRACSDNPGARRGPFRQMLCDQADAIHPIQLDAFEAKRQAMDLMAAPTYDRPAIRALYDRSRADDLKVRAQVENAIVDFAATLPRDKRIRLVEGMRANARRRAMMRQGAAGGN